MIGISLKESIRCVAVTLSFNNGLSNRSILFVASCQQYQGFFEFFAIFSATTAYFDPCTILKFISLSLRLGNAPGPSDGFPVANNFPSSSTKTNVS
mmetsp:Transcript_15597/g.32514  ORF Transcript_15597/g.32514 Transcript_15597/m.32514 type:complete len:96 (+) Transcript_15597:103-390(+)